MVFSLLKQLGKEKREQILAHENKKDKIMKEKNI